MKSAAGVSFPGATVLFLVLFIIKVAILLMIIAAAAEFLPGSYSIGHFPDGYDKIAQNILAGNGYRFFPDTSETLLRPPGFVVLLIAVFYVFGKSLLAVQLLNVLFSITTAAIVLLITRQVIPHRALQNRILLFLPSAIFLFHPGIILAESRGGTETFFTMLITLFVYLLMTALRNPNKLRFLVAGIVLGLAFLTRGTVVLFPAFLLVYLLIQYRLRHKLVLVYFPMMILGMGLMVSPWIIRNYLVTDQFVPAGTLKGVAAYQGLYLNEHAFSEKPVIKLLQEAVAEQIEIADQLNLPHKGDTFFQYFFSPKDEIEFYDHLFQAVKLKYIDDPPLLFKSVGLNFYRFWFQGRSFIATKLNAILMTPFLLLSAFGIYIALKHGLQVGPLVLFMCSFIVPHLPLIALARYSIPLVPFLSILACIPFMRLQEAHESRNLYPSR